MHLSLNKCPLWYSRSYLRVETNEPDISLYTEAVLHWLTTEYWISFALVFKTVKQRRGTEEKLDIDLL